MTFPHYPGFGWNSISIMGKETDMSRMAKAVAAAALFLALGIWGVSPVAAQEACKRVKEYRGGTLYECNGMKMVVLRGNYREMGRQYGGLLKNEIQAFYDGMINKFVLKSGAFNEADLQELLVQPAIKTLAKRQSEMLKGMAEETGLSFEKHALLNSNILVLMYMRKIGAGNAAACTSIAAWGDYTVKGRTYTARNFDFPNIYRELLKSFGLVMVLKPNDGSNSIAGVNIAGMVGFFDGMNDKGLYIEGNNAADSEGLVIYADRSLIFGEVVNMLMDADNIDAFEGRLRTTRASYPLILMAAGPDSACYFENGTTDTKKRTAKEEGLISAANQFLEPSWHIIPMKDRAPGIRRRDRAGWKPWQKRTKGKSMKRR